MTRRFVVLGQITSRGDRMLIHPDDTVEYVAADITDADLAARYDIDEVVRGPHVDVSVGVCLDGPLAGTRLDYVANKLGEVNKVYLPPRPGGPIHAYEIVALAADGKPAQLRFVETT